MKRLSELSAPALAGVVRERSVRAAWAEMKNCHLDGAAMIDLHLSCLADQSEEGLRAVDAMAAGGISDNMCEQISNALEARELIKLRVLDNCDYNAKEAANEIAEAVGAQVVQVIGTRFVLYRESIDHKKIDLSLIR